MRAKKSIVIGLAIFIIFSCASTSELPQEKSNLGNVAVSRADSKTAPQTSSKKSSFQGEGLVIAVPSPQLNSSQNTDKWIPQFMQDSITTNLARYSKMTVIDRANEDLIIAEQELSETGYYDEENALELGKMTNAQLVCIGKIQKTASKYSVNFRVNDIETNEIKAAFSESYSLSQIESGEAVQEISKEILLGLGIELDDKAIAALSKSNDKSITSTKSLAKGYAAQKNGDEIEALYQFMLAGNAGNIGQEAMRNTQTILNGTISGTSVKEKYAQQELLAQKWNKIFEQLGIWLERNLPIFVYDFSTLTDKLSNDKVNIIVKPGVKVIPNRNAISLYMKVISAWEQIALRVNEEEGYNSWVSKVKWQSYLPIPLGDNRAKFEYQLKIGLFTNYGEKFADETIGLYLILPTPYINYNSKHSNWITPSTQEYFDKASFSEVSYFVPLKYLPDDFTVQLYSIGKYKYSHGYDSRKLELHSITEEDIFVYSLEEFKQKYGIK